MNTLNEKKTRETDLIFKGLEPIKINILTNHVEGKVGKGSNTCYSLKLIYKNKTLTFTYHDSIYNYNNHIKLNKKDALYCIIMDMNCFDSCAGIEDFANNFGYELYDDNYTGYNKELLKAYKGCKRTSEALHNIFTSEELEILQEVLQDYQ